MCAYIYQYSSGTFVISLDEYAKSGLTLSADRYYKVRAPHLTIEPRRNILPVEYTDLEIEGILSTDGDYGSSNYIAYTFYLINSGHVPVDVECNVELTEAIKQLNTCARFMVFQDDKPLGIYKEKDDFIAEQDMTPRELFEQSMGTVLCNFVVNEFKPGEVKKYSIILWLEGWDIDCTDEKQGGMVGYSMKFKIIKEYEEN